MRSGTGYRIKNPRRNEKARIRMVECPESIEKVDELEQLLPKCRKELLEQAQARLEAGTANK